MQNAEFRFDVLRQTEVWNHLKTGACMGSREQLYLIADSKERKGPQGKNSQVEYESLS